jgi:hypothetical protein
MTNWKEELLILLGGPGAAAAVIERDRDATTRRLVAAEEGLMDLFGELISTEKRIEKLEAELVQEKERADKAEAGLWLCEKVVKNVSGWVTPPSELFEAVGLAFKDRDEALEAQGEAEYQGYTAGFEDGRHYPLEVSAPEAYGEYERLKVFDDWTPSRQAANQTVLFPDGEE